MFLKLYLRYLKERNPLKWARKIGVNIGSGTLIGSGCEFGSEPYLITIGSHCQITNHVSFFTHGGGNVVRRIDKSFDVFGKIMVHDWAYIGSQSIIMPGVTIGEGSLIAAGSVVTHSIPPGVVAGGNPARIICSIDEYYLKNKPYDVSSKGLSQKEKKQLLLSQSEDSFIQK